MLLLLARRACNIYIVSKQMCTIMHSVGLEGSRGFGPFHFKPKAHAEEEEVLGDE